MPKLLYWKSLFSAILAVVTWNSLSMAATIHEYTGGTINREQIYPGVSFKTPGGGPWADITFSWFVAENGNPSPAAFGSLFLLTEAYAGTPAELSAFANGFVAEAHANDTGAEYVFDPSVTIQPDTTYYFYTNSFNAIYGGGLDPGTVLYATTAGNSNFVSFTTESPTFRLSGDLLQSPGANVPTPEPSSIAFVLTGVMWIGLSRWKLRSVVAR